MVNLYKNLPESPGVYLMKDSRGQVLYIGKAANLRRRVASYFEKAHDYKIERLLSQVKKIDYKKTDTAVEALILESQLIRKYKPPFNVKEKDDKSFLWVEITIEKFPRVLLSRGKGDFGPFTSASSIREALRIIRRIFPFSVHTPSKIGAFHRPCFEYELGLCPGVCVSLINKTEYMKNIKNIKLLLEGKKQKIVKTITKEMEAASKKLEFEKAEKTRRQIFALQHIQDIALISDEKLEMRDEKLKTRGMRIEGYDVSNISGTAAAGSMAVFTNGRPDKNEYRKFKIRTITKSDDVGMLKEILRRRFGNPWPLPALILIDGGVGQVNAAKRVISEFGLNIPVLGMAKGPLRKKNEIVGKIPAGTDRKLLI